MLLRREGDGMSEWIVEIVDGNPHIKKMIPLVRCRECFWHRGGLCLRSKYAEVRDDEWYCADGEKVEQ